MIPKPANKSAQWVLVAVALALTTPCSCFKGVFTSQSSLPGSDSCQQKFNKLGAPPGVDRARGQSRNGVRSMGANADFVSIYVGDGLKGQQLPLSMTKTFRHWILHDGSLRGIFNSEADGGEDGWVDPLSYDEAWLAEDLPLPVLRPAIGALVKGGELRYIMPAVEMSVQCAGKLWWNRGVKTFPVAQRWMDIGSVDLTSLKMYAYGQDGYTTAESSVTEMGEDGEPSVSDDAGAWQELWSADPNKALLALVETLAGEAGEVVESGFHLLVVPVPGEALREAPSPGTRLKLILSGQQPSVADLDDQEPESVSGSQMDVLFRRASAGGTSEYLPKVYKELYTGIVQ